MPILSAAQIYAYAKEGGFSPDEAVIATAISMAESGGNTNAYNPSGATGLWQIDPPQANSSDPLTNAQQAFAKYTSQGWCAWAVFDEGNSNGSPCPGSGTSQRNNSWRGFLPAAQAAAGLTGSSGGSTPVLTGIGNAASGLGSAVSSALGGSSGGSAATGTANAFANYAAGPVVLFFAIVLLIIGLILWGGSNFGSKAQKAATKIFTNQGGEGGAEGAAEVAEVAA